MFELIEIRWHARGGQGAVTASKMLAELALEHNLYFQAFPEYGPERMGAPIQCFNRLSRDPISIYCGITFPNIVVVVDPTLIGIVDITAGLQPEGKILVNSAEEPQEVRRRLGVDGRDIYTLDATRIALETLGQAMPNVPMLGSLIRVLDFIGLDQALNHLRALLSKRFNEKVVEGNLRAFRRAYEEVKGE